MEGTITMWRNSFGFIRVASGRDYFCHIKNWEENTVPPAPGLAVLFELGPGVKGRKEQAVNVRILRVVNAGADALKAGV